MLAPKYKTLPDAEKLKTRRAPPLNSIEKALVAGFHKNLGHALRFFLSPGLYDYPYFAFNQRPIDWMDWTATAAFPTIYSLCVGRDLDLPDELTWHTNASARDRELYYAQVADAFFLTCLVNSISDHYGSYEVQILLGVGRPEARARFMALLDKTSRVYDFIASATYRGSLADIITILTHVVNNNVPTIEVSSICPGDEPRKRVVNHRLWEYRPGYW